MQVDPEVIEQYQANYGGPSDDNETQVPHPRELKKRKRAELVSVRMFAMHGKIISLITFLCCRPPRQRPRNLV